jgi:hypothetical protein
MSFHAVFHQTCKELIPIVLKLFHKTQNDRILPKSLYEATITLIPKPDKDTSKHKLIG